MKIPMNIPALRKTLPRWNIGYRRPGEMDVSMGWTRSVEQHGGHQVWAVPKDGNAIHYGGCGGCKEQRIEIEHPDRSTAVAAAYAAAKAFEDSK